MRKLWKTREVSGRGAKYNRAPDSGSAMVEVDQEFFVGSILVSSTRAGGERRFSTAAAQHVLAGQYRLASKNSFFFSEFAREKSASGCTGSLQRGPMSQPETRASLILQLTGPRREPAWAEFVASYEPFLMRLVQRRGVPARHVADVTQQIFVAIARSVSGWADDGKPESFRRWLNRVAQNVVIRFMTRERKQPGGIGGSDLVEFLETVPAEPDRKLVADYERELIVWAAEQVRGEFRETSWQAFHATVIEARDVAEVAAELGVSPGSIYMSRSRIMARIQKIVGQVTTK